MSEIVDLDSLSTDQAILLIEDYLETARPQRYTGSPMSPFDEHAAEKINLISKGSIRHILQNCHVILEHAASSPETDKKISSEFVERILGGSLTFSVPVAEIVWKILPKIALGLVKPIAKRFIIEVELKEGNNPTISVSYETARIRYKLMLHTHGIPKYQPKVRFPNVRSLGEVKKKAVSPSGLGEIDDSMRLKLYKDEMPANTDIEMFVDFDVKVDAKRLITMDFQEGQTRITRDDLEVTVLVTNTCDFPLEQTLLEVDKSTSYQVREARVLILDKTSRNPIGEIETGSVRKGDDQVKWITCLGPHESLLFKVVTVPM